MSTSYLLIILITAVLLLPSYEMTAQDPPGSRKIIRIAAGSTIEKVFKDIRKQTRLRFSYSNWDVNDQEAITKDLVDVTVEDALKDIFAGRKLSWVYVRNTVCIGKNRPALQGTKPAGGKSTTSINVSGVVTDTAGNPIPWASITLPGRKMGTSTDVAGWFIVPNILPNTTLNVFAMGYEPQQVYIDTGQTDKRIILQRQARDIQEVEVVSTGDQDIIKGKATGSYDKINGELLNLQAGTDLLSNIANLSSGISMTPGEIGPELRVRGLSTIGGFTKPLFILDSFPCIGGLENINPYDIESITILKDADAASSWRARAGNGVIVVNTIRARFHQKLRISFNTNTTIAEKPDIFSNKQMGAADFVNMERYLFAQGFYNYKIAHPEFYAPTPVQTILLKQRQGEISQDEANVLLSRVATADVRNDIYQHYYRNALIQQNAINISAGEKDYAWLISGGMDHNRNALQENHRRYTLRFFNRYKLTKKLELNAGVLYTQHVNKSGVPNPADFRASQLLPYTQFLDDQGNRLPLSTYAPYSESFLKTIGRGKLLDGNYYPLDDHTHIIDKTRSRNIIAQFGLDHKLSNDLYFTASYRFQHQRTEREKEWGIGSYYARELINRFSQVDSNGIVRYIIPMGSIMDLTEMTITSRDFRGQLNFNKKFKAHNIGLVAGGQINEVITRGRSVRYYGFNNDTRAYINVDLVNAYPNIVTGAAEYIPYNDADMGTDYRHVSFYVNTIYTLLDRYILSMGGSRDGTNTFGVKTEDRWKPLWSAGFGWIISDESFYRSPLLDHLKLRITYGKTANLDPSKSGVTTIRYQNQNVPINFSASRMENFYNQGLQREQVSMLNVGVDFNFKNNTVYGSIEYYHKGMSGLYGFSPVDITAGLDRSTIVKNVGEMVANGADIDLNTDNMIGKAKWNANLLINLNRDKVKKLYTKNNLAAMDIVGGGIIGLEGFPARALFAFRSAGLDPATGDPRGYLNGAPSNNYEAILESAKVEDLVYVGGSLPWLSGSLSNTISWKNVSFTARINYNFGYYFRRESVDYDALFNENIGHADYTKRWQKPGDELHTSIPSLRYPNVNGRDPFYMFSNALATSGDHIRLQYLGATYTVSRSPRNKAISYKMQFYIALNNIAMIWMANREDIDPDNRLIKATANISLGAKLSLSRI